MTQGSPPRGADDETVMREAGRAALHEASSRQADETVLRSKSINRVADRSDASETRIRPDRIPSPSCPDVAAPLLRDDPSDETAAPDVINLRRRKDETPGDSKGRQMAYAAEAPAVGLTLRGRYRLERQIGEGGMGQVWLAVDEYLERARDPRPHVALKLLNADIENYPDARTALQREATRAQGLAHPNIATVYGFDVDEAGRPFFTMELLEGRALDGVIREHPSGLPVSQALAIVRHLAAGLAYAHRRGVVHCDFKPGNAYLLGDGLAKVLDFGIARIARDSQWQDAHFDSRTLGALTKSYASVEMIHDAPATPSDDVYALGLVAYELLTGRHPFGRRDAVTAKNENLRPTPVPGLTRRDWNAITKALAFNAADRWVDADAFLRGLERPNPWIARLVVVAVVGGLTAGYTGYRGYIESLPKTPFESLPAQVQVEFRELVDNGDYAYEYGTTRLTGPDALNALVRDALSQYARAYSLHPKNPEVDEKLKASLEAIDAAVGTESVEVRRDTRDVLVGYATDHTALAQYPPLKALINDLSD